MLRKAFTLLIAMIAAASAAKDASTEPAISLLVVTHNQCTHCHRWREEVKPYYHFEAGKSRLPDMEEYDVADMKQYRKILPMLSQPITSLPTFVIMKNKHEVARFSGYNNYSAFFSELVQNVSTVEHQETE